MIKFTEIPLFTLDISFSESHEADGFLSILNNAYDELLDDLEYEVTRVIDHYLENRAGIVGVDVGVNIRRK